MRKFRLAIAGEYLYKPGYLCELRFLGLITKLTRQAASKAYARQTFIACNTQLVGLLRLYKPGGFILFKHANRQALLAIIHRLAAQIATDAHFVATDLHQAAAHFPTRFVLADQLVRAGREVEI